MSAFATNDPLNPVIIAQPGDVVVFNHLISPPDKYHFLNRGKPNPKGFPLTILLTDYAAAMVISKEQCQRNRVEF